MMIAMRTEGKCVQCLTQMLWMILMRMKKKMEVGVLLAAVPKLGAEAPHQEAPHQEAPPPVEMMIVPGIVQPVQAPKKEALKENAILNWGQFKRLEDKMNFWKTPLSNSCMTQ